MIYQIYNTHCDYFEPALFTNYAEAQRAANAKCALYRVYQVLQDGSKVLIPANFDTVIAETNNGVKYTNKWQNMIGHVTVAYDYNDGIQYAPQIQDRHDFMRFLERIDNDTNTVKIIQA